MFPALEKYSSNRGETGVVERKTDSETVKIRMVSGNYPFLFFSYEQGMAMAVKQGKQ